jgi:hypothetical protein
MGFENRASLNSGHKNGGQNLDAKHGPYFYLCSYVSRSVIEAAISWQFVQVLEAHRPANKQTLHINMDESFVPLRWPSKVGLAQAPAGGIRRQFLQQEQMATLATRRAGFTLMASVADDPTIQRLLPHIIPQKSYELKIEGDKCTSSLLSFPTPPLPAIFIQTITAKICMIPAASTATSMLNDI